MQLFYPGTIFLTNQLYICRVAAANFRIHYSPTQAELRANFSNAKQIAEKDYVGEAKLHPPGELMKIRIQFDRSQDAYALGVVIEDDSGKESDPSNLAFFQFPPPESSEPEVAAPSTTPTTPVLVTSPTDAVKIAIADSELNGTAKLIIMVCTPILGAAILAGFIVIIYCCCTKHSARKSTPKSKTDGSMYDSIPHTQTQHPDNPTSQKHGSDVETGMKPPRRIDRLDPFTQSGPYDRKLPVAETSLTDVHPQQPYHLAPPAAHVAPELPRKEKDYQDRSNLLPPKSPRRQRTPDGLAPRQFQYPAPNTSGLKKDKKPPPVLKKPQMHRPVNPLPTLPEDPTHAPGIHHLSTEDIAKRDTACVEYTDACFDQALPHDMPPDDHGFHGSRASGVYHDALGPEQYINQGYQPAAGNPDHFAPYPPIDPVDPAFNVQPKGCNWQMSPHAHGNPNLRSPGGIQPTDATPNPFYRSSLYDQIDADLPGAHTQDVGELSPNMFQKAGAFNNQPKATKEQNPPFPNRRH